MECRRCGQKLPEWRNHALCKPCVAQAQRERRARDPERVRAKDRERLAKETPEQRSQRLLRKRQRYRERDSERLQQERRERNRGRKCRICGHEIPADFVVSRQTCSDECRDEHHRDLCRRNYYKKSGGSPRGSEAAQKRLSAAQKRVWADGGPKLPARECRGCGEEFSPSSGAHRYCSRVCRVDAARARTYGLTLDEYTSLRDKQGGRCAICGHANRGWGGVHRSQSLIVDHCHKTGKVRGFLCGDCNTALGRFGDDPVKLRAAADYLERC